MVNYPPDFPQAAVAIIIKSWRGNSILEDKVAVTNAAWNILGYGLGSTLGNPELMTQQSPQNVLDASIYPNGDVIDDETMLNHLEKWEVSDPESKKKLGAFPIPKELIVKWAISFILKVAAGLV